MININMYMNMDIDIKDKVLKVIQVKETYPEKIIFNKELNIFFIRELEINENDKFLILGDNKNTEYVDIYKCKFNTKIISTLFAENFSNVVTVILNYNNLDSEFVNDIITLMSISKKLTLLDLCDNNFNANDIDCIQKAANEYPNLKLCF